MKIKAECNLSDPFLGLSQEEAESLLSGFGEKKETLTGKKLDLSKALRLGAELQGSDIPIN